MTFITKTEKVMSGFGPLMAEIVSMSNAQQKSFFNLATRSGRLFPALILNGDYHYHLTR